MSKYVHKTMKAEWKMICIGDECEARCVCGREGLEGMDGREVGTVNSTAAEGRPSKYYVNAPWGLI